MSQCADRTRQLSSANQMSLFMKLKRLQDAAGGGGAGWNQRCHGLPFWVRPTAAVREQTRRERRRAYPPVDIFEAEVVPLVEAVPASGR